VSSVSLLLPLLARGEDRTLARVGVAAGQAPFLFALFVAQDSAYVGSWPVVEGPTLGDDVAFAALGRIYDHLGDGAAEERILELRLSRAGTSAPSADPDLYFRLARTKLAQPATVGEGLALLTKALDLKLDPTEAQRALTKVDATACARARPRCASCRA